MQINKHIKEVAFLVVAGTALSLFVLVQGNKLSKKQVFTTNVPAQTVTVETPVITEQNESMDSPDGTLSLALRSTPKSSGKSYSVYTKSQNDPEKQIAKLDISDPGKVTIPYNTWSPDNKYIFLKEMGTADDNYIVYSLDEAYKTPNYQPIRVGDLFAERLPDFKITEATGWASPTLLIVNAVSRGDGSKVSFWFDVTGNYFTRLDLYFN